MVNSLLGARSPKGTVGVRGVIDAGELSAYSQGVLSGFAATSAASLTLQLGGTSGTQDVAIAKNPGGESELLVSTAGQSLAFIIGSAPGTAGQSRTDALVAWKDVSVTSAVNDGIDAVFYQVVPGTAATTGTQVPPSLATIRSTIANGTLAFVAILGYVTIANGASSITTGNFYRNHSMMQTLVVANATELAFITPSKGMQAFQTDTNVLYVYNGTSWLPLSPFPSGGGEAYVLTTENTTSTSYAKLATTTDKVTAVIGPSGKALVSVAAWVAQAATLQAQIVVGISGATTVTPTAFATARGYAQGIPASGSFAQTVTRTWLVTGLNAGSTTFDMYYATSTSTATFGGRGITVVPI